MSDQFRATYRLQLHPEFRFSDAEALVPFLARLGVSHLYLSPIMQARAGSTHGYDVVDHNQLNPELGGRAGFEALLATVRAHGMGLILDFVPNHAGIGTENEAWQDVLAYGPASPFARLFDIDWHPLKPELDGKVLLPFLGKTYGEALDGGELAVTFTEGRFCLSYYDNRFALSPASYARILGEALPRYERQEAYFDLKEMTEAYATLEPIERDKAETLRLRLSAMADRVDFDEAASLCSGEELHEILEKQFWRLSYWKTAGHEINYRRFFDINGLAALRMEDERVFWQAHRLLGELLTLEGVDGVRLDHIDGLFDPHAYLQRLRELGAQHLWVEKIRGHGEVLPLEWPVEGTTGYRFMNDAVGLLVNPDGEEGLNRTYSRFDPDARTFDEEVYRSKKLVMNTSLSSELFRLSYELDRISESDYHTRDFTLEALREALVETIASLDRYRTYLPYETVEAADVLRTTIELAMRRTPAGERSVFIFIENVLTGELPEKLRAEQQQWIGRFQQYTAPVTAKGVEDTAFYRWVRLAALNEVGGHPDRFTTPPEVVHAHARYRAHLMPNTLLATATHDHKRGEDTRMRLAALSEVPQQWAETVDALREIGQEHIGLDAPLRSDQYLFFQTLVALWPEENPDTLADRLWTYAQKAARESKQHTSWIYIDEAYEAALERFVRGVTTDARTPEAVGELAALLARYGFFNTISQTILKLTQPGVPDIYQGSELLDLSLVDPDNRRVVDFKLRSAVLDRLQPLLASPDREALRALFDKQDTQLKLYLLTALLHLRKEHSVAFGGRYQALAVAGDDAERWFCFARGEGTDALVVALPRFASRPLASTTLVLPEPLHGHSWRHAFSGETTKTDQLSLDGIFPWNVWTSHPPQPSPASR